MRSMKAWILRNGLMIGILAGIVAGTLLGGLAPAWGRETEILGKLFLNALMLLIIPLVVASMIVGVTGQGDIRKLGGLGLKTFIYYMATTAISVTIGILLVIAIRPGVADTEAEQLQLRGGQSGPDTAWNIQGNRITLEKDSFRSFTENHVIRLEGGIEGRIPEGERSAPAPSLEVREWTGGVPPSSGKGFLVDLAAAENIDQMTIGEMLRKRALELVPKNIFKTMADGEVLPLIICALIFGAVLTTLGPTGEPVIRFFTGFNAAIMKIVHLVMLTSPLGIGALVAARIGGAGGFAEFLPELQKVGAYAATVIAGLLIHAVIVLPLLLKLLGRKNILSYFRNMLPALLTACSTASSSATLPTTIRCVQERNGVSEKTSGFVLPLGATINMDGTALYEAVAVIFIAQIYGIDLGPVQLLIVFLTATLAAIGAAAIPEAGLVTMAIVLAAVGVPIEGISLILFVDWFLDRLRTTVNVWGDSVGAAVIEPKGLPAEAVTPEAERP